MAAIRARLQQLEKEVERLQNVSPQGDARDRPISEHQPEQKIDGSVSAPPKASHGMLLVQSESKSRYVGNEASVILGDKVRHLCCTSMMDY